MDQLGTFVALSQDNQIKALTSVAFDAAEQFGIKVKELKNISHSFNSTFQLIDDDLVKYSLRVNLNFERDQSAIKAEHKWLSEIEKIGKILISIKRINEMRIVGKFLVFSKIIEDTERVVLEALSLNAGDAEIVREIVELSKILKCDKKLILKLFEKIINFTELTIMSNSVPIETVVVLLEALPDIDREIVGKELVTKLPVSNQKLRLVEYFGSCSWVSAGDVLLLRNRLILRENNLDFLEDTLVEEKGVKRVIERIFVEQKLSNETRVVTKLVEVNKLNWEKFQLERMKRWLETDEEDAVLRLIRCGDRTNEGHEKKLILTLLRMFFDVDEKPAVKVACFRVLMKAFPLSVIKQVYGKRTEDLIDIEKNLVFMDVLVSNKIIKSHDIKYKEFYELSKAAIAKGLVKHSNKMATLTIAAWIMSDFVLRDFEISNGLKSRLMSHGIEGMEIIHALRLDGEVTQEIETRFSSPKLIRSGNDLKPSDENTISN